VVTGTTLVPSSPSLHQTKLFLFSGFTQEEEEEMEAITVRLGGKLAARARSHGFVESATHVIFKELKRVEKFLCGCAAGAWILKPDYLYISSYLKIVT